MHFVFGRCGIAAHFEGANVAGLYERDVDGGWGEGLLHGVYERVLVGALQVILDECVAYLLFLVWLRLCGCASDCLVQVGGQVRVRGGGECDW